MLGNNSGKEIISRSFYIGFEMSLFHYHREKKPRTSIEFCQRKHIKKCKEYKPKTEKTKKNSPSLLYI